MLVLRNLLGRPFLVASKSMANHIFPAKSIPLIGRHVEVVLDVYWSLVPYSSLSFFIRGQRVETLMKGRPC